jgi:hypothetical protein
MREIIFTVLLVGSIGSAFCIGDRTAKRVAGVLTLAALATWLLPSSINERFAHVSIGLITIDAMTWIALLGITACSEKPWTSWIAAMQGMAVLSHLARLGPSIKTLVYFIGTVAWSWPMVILLLGAVLVDWPPIRQRLARSSPTLFAR